MRGNRYIGMWAGENWDLREYAWRGPCLKSPLTGEQMRGIVALDERGMFHPGLRNSERREAGPEYKTVYQDFTGYRNKERAVAEAEEMLREAMKHHQETHEYLNPAQKYGGPGQQQKEINSLGRRR